MEEVLKRCEDARHFCAWCLGPTLDLMSVAIENAQHKMKTKFLDGPHKNQLCKLLQAAFESAMNAKGALRTFYRKRLFIAFRAASASLPKTFVVMFRPL